MNRQETAQVLGILKTAYPSSFKDSDPEHVVGLWQEMFKDVPAGLVGAAVKALISERLEGYSPTIGEINAKIRLLSEEDELTESQAWALVSKACRNGIYGYEKEYAKLPPDVQKAVGNAEQIREWAMMDEDTVGSVVASNFMRNYRTAAKRSKELAKLPADVRQLIEQTKTMKLEARNE